VLKVCGRLKVLIPRGDLILPQSRESAEVRAQPYSSGAHRPCSARAITIDNLEGVYLFVERSRIRGLIDS
jgi:hypothetical protein